MKLQKLILSVAAVICTSLCLCSAARAVDLNDERFSGKTWDEVMTDFLAEHETDASQVTAGYYNTVTGEEYYLNPDQLMYGASVAKLPTNMLYAERVYNGEMTMETLIRGNRYELLQRLSLVNSDNPAMETMVKDLGGGVTRKDQAGENFDESHYFAMLTYTHEKFSSFRFECDFVFGNAHRL